MKKIWITIGVVIIIALAIILVVTKTKKEPEEIKIGAIFALTGDAAKYGERSKNGIELALEEINRKSINGKKIKIIYEDSQGDPQKAVSSVQKLMNLDKVNFIIGPLSSPEVLAIAPLAERNKIIVLTPSATAPQITYAGDYIFRNAMSDIFEGEAVAMFVYKELKKNRGGVIYINNDFGLGLGGAFKKKFESLGGRVIAEESFERRDTDFRTQLSKIKEKNVEVLFVIGYAEMGQILKQTREIGIKSQIVSVSNLEDPEILKVAANAVEGAYYTYRVPDLQSEDKVVQEFTRRFKEEYREDPDVFAAFSYDAMRILAYALEKGGTHVEDVKKALYNIRDFSGVAGKTTFDENGDVIQPIGIKMIKDGEFVWVDKKFEMEERK